MSTTDSDPVIPQWKRDLIARLRSQNKRTASVGDRQPFHPPAPPPAGARALPARAPPVTSRPSSGERCRSSSPPTMAYDRDSDSDSDLRYGPGIVTRLRAKFLSLSARDRPLRRAASLEHLLEAAPPPPPRRPTLELKRARSVEAISAPANRDAVYQPQVNRPKRIAPLMSDKEKPPIDLVKQQKMKFERGGNNRTKAVTGNVAEKIATFRNRIYETKTTQNKKPPIKLKPTNLLDNKTNGVTFRKKRDNVTTKRDKVVDCEVNNLIITSVFETSDEFGRYENESNNSNDLPDSPLNSPILSPINLVKRQVSDDPFLSPVKMVKRHSDGPLLSPVKLGKRQVSENGPLSPVRLGKRQSEDGPLLSPVKLVNPLEVTPLVKLVKRQSDDGPLLSPVKLVNPQVSEVSPLISLGKRQSEDGPLLSPIKLVNAQISEVNSPLLSPVRSCLSEDVESGKRITSESLEKIKSASNTVTFNFVKNGVNHQCESKSAVINRNVSNIQTPPLQPLKVDVNGIQSLEIIKKPFKTIHKEIISENVTITNKIVASPTKIVGALNNTKSNLTIVEIEKNLKNTAKLNEQAKNNRSGSNNSVVVEEVKILIPKVKKSPSRETENNSIVFKFTDRTDIPDYVCNEGINRSVKIEKPKIGEGGIILLPGATIDFTDDDDDEALKSLECPPSPCDVIFINDNILIDGKSSLSQKKKRSKMKISFLDAGPDVFEYPSESSLLIEISPTQSSPSSTNNAQHIGHTTPSLTGASSLANYQPKSTEEFQPGVTRIPSIPTQHTTIEAETEPNLCEAEDPILFSAGTNSDMLF